MNLAARTPQFDAPKAVPSVAATTAPSSSSDDRAVASPLAKKMAQEIGVDIASVVGNGPGGRKFFMNKCIFQKFPSTTDSFLFQ